MKRLPIVIFSLLFVVVIVLVGSFRAHAPENGSPYTKSSLVVGGKTITVDLADDTAKRTQGLSGRTSLGPDEGMLFVFETSGTYGFWMKDMNFPIDILWLDEGGNIVYIEKNFSPDSYPRTVTPPRPARYVLEVVSGFSDAHHVRVGDNVQFSQKF